MKMQRFRDDLADDEEIFDWAKEYDFKDESKRAFGTDTESYNSDISTDVLQVMIDHDIISDDQNENTENESNMQLQEIEDESSIESQSESESYSTETIHSN